LPLALCAASQPRAHLLASDEGRKRRRRAGWILSGRRRDAQDAG